MSQLHIFFWIVTLNFFPLRIHILQFWILSLHCSIIFCRTASYILVIANFISLFCFFLNSISENKSLNCKLPITKRKKNCQIKHCSYLFYFLAERSFHRSKNRLFNFWMSKRGEMILFNGPAVANSLLKCYSPHLLSLSSHPGLSLHSEQGPMCCLK